MCLYFLNYLCWVFPVDFKLSGENVIYNGTLYSDSRELFRRLYEDHKFLGDKYYNTRCICNIKKLSEVCQDEDDFICKARREIALIAFYLGFEVRIKRIFLVMDDELNDWYYYLVVSDVNKLRLIVLKYVTDTYKRLLNIPDLVSIMKSFVERHRDEFIKRFEQQQPELAEILKELDWPNERDKFFGGDSEFKQELLERLNAKGKGHLLEHFLGKDLGL
ncbi:hypothetical protein [Pseudomonas fluorescens]|uniref:Uncharacterized protein n=1 Tax=Pseudomonas fluorescens TaxID=294 RepID=A0A0F4VFF3_PSEFL|nr:hypothetical protein [Pseudomonas fluorescens]KJZ67260.1 hypothetical protein VD17_03095 [Pseudomonas fluorescens]